MDRIPDLIATSIKNDLSQVERIANNSANVTTPGFKALLNSQSSDSNSLQHLMDISNGELRQTSRPLDIAILGKGWLLVKNGSNYLLTRNGQLQLNKMGKLVDANGALIQGERGDISLSLDSPRISSSGKITENGKEIESLLFVEPSGVSEQDIQAGYIKVSKNTDLKLVSETVVHQGYLEGANVDPASMTIDLIQYRRHIETMQKTLSIYNSVIDKTITDLGK